MKAKKDNSFFAYYGFTKRDAKKYPVISGILKQLTPERIKKEIEEIQKVELPPELQKWVKEYEKVGERDEFIWKWIYNADRNITSLFNISRKYYYSIIETSFLFHMLTNLIDDISEKIYSNNLLNELLKIPFNQKDIKINKLRKKGSGAFFLSLFFKLTGVAPLFFFGSPNTGSLAHSE